MAKRPIHKEISQWNSEFVLFLNFLAVACALSQHVLKKLEGRDVGIIRDANGVSIVGCQKAQFDDPTLDIAIVMLPDDHLMYLKSCHLLTEADYKKELINRRECYSTVIRHHPFIADTTFQLKKCFAVLLKN